MNQFKMKSICLIVQKMEHFMRILDQYLYSAVLEEKWDKFQTNLNTSKSLDQLIQVNKSLDS